MEDIWANMRYGNGSKPTHNTYGFASNQAVSVTMDRPWTFWSPLVVLPKRSPQQQCCTLRLMIDSLNTAKLIRIYFNPDISWYHTLAILKGTYLEVSWNGATPYHHPFLDGIFPYKPSIWGYPHFRKSPYPPSRSSIKRRLRDHHYTALIQQLFNRCR